MKGNRRQMAPLDWTFFGVSIAMVIAGGSSIAPGNMIGVWLVVIGVYASYSNLHREKVGRGTGVFFIVIGAASLIWCIIYAIFLLRLEPVIRDWAAGLGWLLFGIACLPMGIYFIKSKEAADYILKGHKAMKEAEAAPNQEEEKPQ